MELPALTAFSPANARMAVASINTPTAASDLRMVLRRPKTIKKLSVDAAKQVIVAVDDPHDLVALLKVGDKRIALRKALSAHRLRPRADALSRRPHEVLQGKPLSVCVDDLRPLLAEFNINTLVGLVAWVERLPASERSDATRLVYRECSHLEQDVRGHRMIRLLGILSPLALQVLLGRVEGVSMEDLHEELPGTEDFYVAASLDQIHEISAWEADVLVKRKLPVPYDTVGRLDPEVVAVLSACRSEIPHLMKHGYITEPDFIAECCRGMTSVELRSVLAETSDTKVAELLLPELAYKGVRKEFDSLHMLNTFANLSTEARQIVLTNASMMDLRYFMNGRTVNIPRPGDLRSFVRAIASGRPTYTGMHALIDTAHSGGSDIQSAPLQELAEEVVQVGSAQQLLSQPSRLGQMAVEIIVAICGDDPSIWTNVASLAQEWDGTIQQLALTARELA